MLRLQSLVSEEDEDEDEEEGKAAVQADEKMKNNKPGLHGAALLSSINEKLMLCDGGEVSTRCQLFQTSWFPGRPTGREFLSDTALWAPEMQPGIRRFSEEFPVKVSFFFFKKTRSCFPQRSAHAGGALSLFSHQQVPAFQRGRVQQRAAADGEHGPAAPARSLARSLRSLASF